MGRNGTRVVLDLLPEKVESGLKLGVGAGEGGVGKIVDDGVGFNAAAFNEPGAVWAIYADLRSGGEAVVGLSIIEGKPDFAAPGAGADDLAKLEMLEALREGFAVGGRILVAENDDVSAECVLHIPVGIADAWLPVEPCLAKQIAEQP